ncbi:cilia- and flagella-associated protein 20-like isoform X2 [Coccinella septempunctata]|uniref:cilia- and flagella-associated protein 20-like isoform X2 n=1 Tax=Coccinella septempunctata TaxID=41139 RepID=UPI001D09653D|nr:cilia- and flagella-associated protein 20-like isoform X2 [Coccinella septempunctata]
MFANAFQSGFISIFYSVGSAPLSIWNKEVKNGHIRRVVDEEVKSLVLEIAGTNVATTYITCPQKPRVSLAIKLPFLVMIIKNMKKYFTFEIQILDDKDIRRRFRVSNFQSTTKVRPFCTTMPIGLSDGWNQVQFNLADFTKRAYGSTYLETVRVQVHANVRIRRIYFSDTLYSEDEMPNEFRLFLPTAATKAKAREKGKVEKKAPTKAAAVEEVPSGAPPSPVETPAPPDEGPLPTAEAHEEPQEATKAGEEAEEAAKEEEAAPEETTAEKEEPADAGQDAEPTAEAEPVPENEGLPGSEVPAAQEVQPEQEESEPPPESTEPTAEESPPEEQPAAEPPAEEAPIEG